MPSIKKRHTRISGQGRDLARVNVKGITPEARERINFQARENYYMDREEGRAAAWEEKKTRPGGGRGQHLHQKN